MENKLKTHKKAKSFVITETHAPSQFYKQYEMQSNRSFTGVNPPQPIICSAAYLITRTLSTQKWLTNVLIDTSAKKRPESESFSAT